MSSANQRPVIVWFRNDLRLADNPAVAAAAATGAPVVALYIYAPEDEGAWRPGAASRWWLHHSLCSLRERLAQAGNQLIVRCGNTVEELGAAVKQSRATRVFTNSRVEPFARSVEAQCARMLVECGADLVTFQSSWLAAPGTVVNGQGCAYQVFTPFFKTWSSIVAARPVIEAPQHIAKLHGNPRSMSVESLGLLPKLNWADEFSSHARPGEFGARKALAAFINEGAEDYAASRDLLGSEGTSRLSAHLHFGEISPNEVVHALEQRTGPAWKSSKYVAELAWREFAAHLLHAFPHLPERPMRPEFERFEYRAERGEVLDWLAAWQRGRTGYPVVDAAMRQLWATGWMHNRARMIVASFLIKDLLIDWRTGAKWFWDTLVDADLANNTMGWQWAAGCGPDAAPFFRIFNPITQGEKFDPKGKYVRRWVPELRNLADEWIHQPWKAPSAALGKAGVELGRTYPEPIINHAIAREVALEKYQRLRQQSA
ncbi:MAG TPA: deoxyribodipyrimidine photo-lyase [Methylomirabilota bacterium]|nr:deoxyribodipyrimidine photo-lyase [Methylomirabilota bacterium]